MRKLLLKSLVQGPLTEAAPPPDEAALAELAAQVERASRRRLGRSLSIREVDAGSCNGCELEIHALHNVLYDLERFGLRFVASPRHADVLLVTGPVTADIRQRAEAAPACRQARARLLDGARQSAGDRAPRLLRLRLPAARPGARLRRALRPAPLAAGDGGGAELHFGRARAFQRSELSQARAR